MAFACSSSPSLCVRSLKQFAQPLDAERIDRGRQTRIGGDDVSKRSQIEAPTPPKHVEEPGLGPVEILGADRAPPHAIETLGFGLAPVEAFARSDEALPHTVTSVAVNVCSSKSSRNRSGTRFGLSPAVVKRVAGAKARLVLADRRLEVRRRRRAMHQHRPAHAAGEDLTRPLELVAARPRGNEASARRLERTETPVAEPLRLTPGFCM
jgi:hypothetical protein